MLKPIAVKGYIISRRVGDISINDLVKKDNSFIPIKHIETANGRAKDYSFNESREF